ATPFTPPFSFSHQCSEINNLLIETLSNNLAILLLQLHTNGFAAQVAGGQQGRARSGERVSDGPWWALFDKPFHQKNRFRCRVGVSTVHWGFRVDKNVRASLTFEPVAQHIDFLVAVAPGEGQVTHSWIITFGPEDR